MVTDYSSLDCWNNSSFALPVLACTHDWHFLALFFNLHVGIFHYMMFQIISVAVALLVSGTCIAFLFQC